MDSNSSVTRGSKSVSENQTFCLTGANETQRALSRISRANFKASRKTIISIKLNSVGQMKMKLLPEKQTFVDWLLFCYKIMRELKKHKFSNLLDSFGEFECLWAHTVTNGSHAHHQCTQFLPRPIFFTHSSPNWRRISMTWFHVTQLNVCHLMGHS